MNAMDVSDVYYDQFLINGKNINHQPQFKADDQVRLRIANAGASSLFLAIPEEESSVKLLMATVTPVQVDRLLIAPYLKPMM